MTEKPRIRINRNRCNDGHLWVCGDLKHDGYHHVGTGNSPADAFKQWAKPDMTFGMFADWDFHSLIKASR